MFKFLVLVACVALAKCQQKTNGGDGLASGAQVNVLPVDVSNNNALQLLNGVQAVVPVDASNILNNDNIANPVVGSLDAALPVNVLGTSVLSQLLRRKRQQTTNGGDGLASGLQGNVLPVDVTGNNIGQIGNGIQALIPVDASNILNKDNIANPVVGSVDAALPVNVIGTSVLSQLLRRKRQQTTNGGDGLASGVQGNVLPVDVTGNNIGQIGNGIQAAIPIHASDILNGDNIGDAKIDQIGVLAPISLIDDEIASHLLRRKRQQTTNGGNGLASGVQANALPVDVTGNNILQALNNVQAVAPIDLNNIANNDNILDPEFGSIGLAAPVNVIGDKIASQLLRRKRQQTTNGGDGLASGAQVNALPIDVSKNNIGQIGNNIQAAIPIDLQNIANNDSILNPQIGSIGLAVPILAAGDQIANNILGNGLPLGL